MRVHYVRSLSAAILAPMLLALFIVATDSADRHSSTFYALAIVMAQVLFWLAFLLMAAVTRVPGVAASHLRVVIYAVAMFLLSGAGYAATFLLLGGTFRWLGVVRDSVGLSISGAASFLLYRAILHAVRGQPEVPGA